MSGNYGIYIARTVDETLWNDLPFLATDMTGFWIESCAHMSSVQRLNFPSFLAKLASTRVSKDRVCQIALVIFRTTFEENRDLVTTEKHEEEDTRRGMGELSIADLLPAACAWIKEANDNLIQLSDVFWNDCPSTVGQGGPNFVKSALGKRSPAGFTPWRWMYWLKRLSEIQEEAQEANEKRLETYAKDAIEYMASRAKDQNAGFLQAYQSGELGLQRDRHLVYLNKEHEFEGIRLD